MGQREASEEDYTVNRFQYQEDVGSRTTAAEVISADNSCHFRVKMKGKGSSEMFQIYWHGDKSIKVEHVSAGVLSSVGPLVF